MGLGYIGCVSAACLADNGHHVVGVDIKPDKVRMVKEGRSPITEPGLPELIRKGVDAGQLEATRNARRAIQDAELVVICVGTPSGRHGGVSLRAVQKVCQEVGEALAESDDYKVISIRSTIPPGTAAGRLIPAIEERSGKRIGQDFGFCTNPEFLREGSAISDFMQPSYTIIGEYDERSGDRMAGVYGFTDAPLHRVPLGVAEMVKYASNAFHALKVTFANELGNICQAYGIDSHEVMEVFIQDERLNISPKYLKPGFAFGGPCLGKDMRALVYAARHQDVSVPVLGATLRSNRRQIAKVVEMIEEEGRKPLGMIGLSFKTNSDDLRESPAVTLAERLLGKGFPLEIYDHEVALAQIYGRNKDYVTRVLPHISELLLDSLPQVVNKAEIVVVTKPLKPDKQRELFDLLRPDQTLIDLVRLDQELVEGFEGKYLGIGW